MADKSFLDWPFFEDRHRALAQAARCLGRPPISAPSTTPTSTPPAAISSPCSAATAGWL